MADHPVPVLGEGEELQGNARDPNPFEDFPELVWENILNKLETHSDLWNLLKAYPALNGVTKWIEVLFDQVLPLIFKDLDKEHILACRETCKWWKKSVDNFLDNHPSQQPYDPSSFATITGYRYGALQFQDIAYNDIVGPEEVLQVRQDAHYLLERHSIIPKFVGKSARFQLGNPHSKQVPNDFFDELDQFLIPELQLGASIWYVEFTKAWSNLCYPEYQQKLQGWLENLPNLKSLSVTTYYGHGTDVVRDSVFARLLEQQTINNTYSLPDIPQLESLKLTDSRTMQNSSGEALIPMADFSHALINKYAPQLRKLTIAINLWKDEYGSKLENLTELSLDLESDDPLLDSHAVRSLFSSLNAPNLEKLGIKVKGMDCLEEVLEIIQNRSFKVLKINTFSFDDYVVIYENPIMSNVQALIIEAFLDMGDGDIPSPAILGCFPELEYLEIRNGINIYDNENDDDEGEEDNDLNPGWRRITVEFGPPEDSDDEENEDIVIWKLFPKLKVFVQDGKSYAREMYERDV